MAQVLIQGHLLCDTMGTDLRRHDPDGSLYMGKMQSEERNNIEREKITKRAHLLILHSTTNIPS